MKKSYYPQRKPNEVVFKELHHNRWISLRQIGNYVYSHESRANGELVAILITDSTREPGTVLGRFELCPAHFDDFALASFTGGVEHGSAALTAVHEIKEEAGYVAQVDELVYLGTCRPSKSADTVVHLFAWDAKGQNPGTISGDGSEGEHGAYAKWVTYQEAFACKDPLMSILLGRFLVRNGAV